MRRKKDRCAGKVPGCSHSTPNPIIKQTTPKIYYKTDTNVPRNLEIRMKTKILSYLQNQLEFFQQSGDKLHDLHRWVSVTS